MRHDIYSDCDPTARVPNIHQRYVSFALRHASLGITECSQDMMGSLHVLSRVEIRATIVRNLWILNYLIILSPSLLYVSTEHLLHIQYLSISRRKAGSMPVSLLFIRIQHRADLKANMESKPEIPLRLASFLFQLFCSGGSNMYLT